MFDAILGHNARQKYTDARLNHRNLKMNPNDIRTMEFRNSIAPTGVNIPAKVVDFCLRVGQEGWAAANGWTNGGPAAHPVSLTAGASA